MGKLTLVRGCDGQGRGYNGNFGVKWQKMNEKMNEKMNPDLKKAQNDEKMK